MPKNVKLCWKELVENLGIYQSFVLHTFHYALHFISPWVFNSATGITGVRMKSLSHHILCLDLFWTLTEENLHWGLDEKVTNLEWFSYPLFQCHGLYTLKNSLGGLCHDCKGRISLMKEGFGGVNPDLHWFTSGFACDRRILMIYGLGLWFHELKG